VTKQDEDGWWHGVDSEGHAGLFPADFVERIEGPAYLILYRFFSFNETCLIWKGSTGDVVSNQMRDRWKQRLTQKDTKPRQWLKAIAHWDEG
jgi:hypothetical protein